MIGFSGIRIIRRVFNGYPVISWPSNVTSLTTLATNVNDYQTAIVNNDRGMGKRKAVEDAANIVHEDLITILAMAQLKMNANVAHGAGAMFAERKAAIQKAANNEHIKLVDKEPSVVGKAWSKVKKATKRFKKDPEFIDNEDVEFIEGLEKY